MLIFDSSLYNMKNYMMCLKITYMLVGKEHQRINTKDSRYKSYKQLLGTGGSVMAVLLMLLRE